MAGGEGGGRKGKVISRQLLLKEVLKDVEAHVFIAHVLMF